MQKETDDGRLAEMLKEWQGREVEQVWVIGMLGMASSLSVRVPNLGNYNETTGQTFSPAAFFK